MSGLGDALFGSEGTPSRVVDTTPDAFANLRTPLARRFRQQLFNPAQFQGQFAAPMAPGEQQALQGTQQAAGQVGQGTQGQQLLAGAGQMNPFAGLAPMEQQALGAIGQQAFQGANPQAQQFLQQQLGGQQNPFAQAAGLTGGEQAGLQAVQQRALADNPQAQQFLQQQLGGQMNPFAQSAGLTGAEQQGLGVIQNQAFDPNQQIQSFVNQQLGGVANPFAQVSAPEQQGLQQVQQTAFGSNPLQQAVTQGIGQLASGQQNPYAQQLMEAAVRPIEQQFSEEALRQRGLFTGAGQQVQGQGSSPFAQASARLSGNVANAIGDTTAQLGSDLFQQQQQAQLQALGLGQQQPGIDLQNQLAGLEAAGLPRELQSDAFQQMQSNQFTAAGLGDQFASNTLARALQGQEALSLPRQVQQAGLDRQAGAFDTARESAFRAAGLGEQLTGSALERALQGTEAAGLPRQVQQAGLDRQAQAFEAAQGRGLQAAGLGDQLSSNALQRALAGFEAAGAGQERAGQAFEQQQARQLQAGSQLGSQQLAQETAQLEAQLQNLQAQGLPRLIEQMGIEGGLAEFERQRNELMQLLATGGNLAAGQQAVLPGTSGTPGALQSFAGAFGQGLGSSILPG